jgi:large subunit ribosomal protein L28
MSDWILAEPPLNVKQQVGYMSRKCEICGKVSVVGRNVSHSKVSTPRTYRPNIHKALVIVKGESRQMKICTRCLRTLTRSRA